MLSKIAEPASNLHPSVMDVKHINETEAPFRFASIKPFLISVSNLRFIIYFNNDSTLLVLITTNLSHSESLPSSIS